MRRYSTLLESQRDARASHLVVCYCFAQREFVVGVNSLTQI